MFNDWPLYFIYKIVSTINLCIKLKEKYPKFNFIPIYWMASEDHDFDEISSFKFQDKKFQWKEDLNGPVGKLPLEKLKFILEDFESCLGNKNEANQIRELIKNSYQNLLICQRQHLSLSTNFLVIMVY